MSEIETLKLELKLETERLNESQQNVMKAASFGKDLLQQNGQLKAEIESLKDIANKEKKRCKDVLAETVDIEEKLQLEHSTELKRLSEEKESIRQRLIAKQAESTSLATNVEELQKQSLEKSNEISQLQDEIQSKKSTKIIETHIEEYDSKISNLEEELVTIQSDRDTFSQALQMAQMKLEENIQKISIISEENECLRNTSKDKSESIEKLKERNNDLEFEVQELKATALTSATATDSAGQGNSLFGEVEDQRRMTAQKLLDLEENYKTKIENYDSIEAENKSLKRQTLHLEQELGNKIVSDAHNKRLLEELLNMREARDAAISQAETFKSFSNITQPTDAADPTRQKERLQQKDAELRNLNNKIQQHLLDKIGQADRIRDLNSRLALTEEKVVTLQTKLSQKSGNSKDNLQVTDVENVTFQPPQKVLRKLSPEEYVSGDAACKIKEIEEATSDCKTQ